MLLTKINNLLEITEAVLPMVKNSTPINKPAVFKTQSQINRDVTDKIKTVKKTTTNPAFRKEAAKNMLLKQNALRRDPILKRLDAQREARLNKDGVKSNTVSI
jgi:hypothetical protein